MKQKFKDVTTAMYISHVTLHEKHPVFGKLDILTLKSLLKESSIISLVEGQVLYDLE